MRLFAAIPVGPPAAGVLTDLLDRWRVTDWPVKWVRGEGLHVTLKFLGSVDEPRMDAVRDSLGSAIAGTPGLSFTLAELGAFPSLEAGRVLWAGLESESALELLVHRIERACATLGFPLEGRPFRPHVTLGRIREGSRLSGSATQAIEATRLEPASFMSDAIVLFQSLTGPGGSRYEPRATFPLGSR
jgi:2'-5' RNA ligase